MLRLNSLDSVFDFEFSGCDVKWNCERVGKKGIVYVREEDDLCCHFRTSIQNVCNPICAFFFLEGGGRGGWQILLDGAE